MHRFKGLFLFLLFFNFSCGAQLLCPSEQAIQQSRIDFPLPVPDVTSPWRMDYLTMGHVSNHGVGWYIFDGLFTGTQSREETLSKGQALLNSAKTPLGPYTGILTGMHYCLYHYSVFDRWDHRPKFIVAINASEPITSQHVLQLLPNLPAY